MRRIGRWAVISSKTWAVSPTVRAMAKRPLPISGGKSISHSTAAMAPSTFIGKSWPNASFIASRMRLPISTYSPATPSSSHKANSLMVRGSSLWMRWP